MIPVWSNSTGLNSKPAILYLDFTTSTYSNNGNGYALASVPGYSFTRASTGYAEDLAGNLISFASGAPRSTNKGVLIEEARTNTIIRSQEFSSASWAYNGVSVVADQATAPDGTLTADKLTSTTGGNYAYPGNSTLINAAGGAAYTLSGFFKDIDATNVELVMAAATPTQTYAARFNLSTGTPTVTGSTGGGTATAIMTQLANGWWRCILMVSAVASSSYCEMQYRITSASKSVYVWGAQLEQGAFATSYIPTTSASATRAADNLTFTGALLPSNDWTVFANVVGMASGQTGKFPALYTFYDAGIVSAFQTYANSGGASLSATEYNGGAIFDTLYGVSVVSSGAVRSAISKTGTAVRGSAAGLSAVSMGTWSPYTISRMNVGQTNAANYLNGYLQRLAVFPSAYSNAQLQALTAA